MLFPDFLKGKVYNGKKVIDFGLTDIAGDVVLRV
jgi:hypothetical protein